MNIRTKASFNIYIYIAGDISFISQACRKYCKEIGFCVTVTPINFIYTGGEELGACIGIVKYPRFDDTNAGLREKAIELATLLIEATHQWSALVVTPEESIWLTTREVAE